MAEHEKAVEIPSEPSSTEVHDPAEDYRVDVDNDPDAKTDHEEDDDPEQHAGEFSDQEDNN